jgi:hypothetical protein
MNPQVGLFTANPEREKGAVVRKSKGFGLQ